MTKSNLPAEVHDHFRKANVLHGYVEKALGEATKHALETGQELQAAKATIPHGLWESECDRLFDGSARNARFYMEFSRHMAALPKRRAGAVLLLESTLKGAAKAAKAAANPPAEEPEEQQNSETGQDSPGEPPINEEYFDSLATGEEEEQGTTPEEEAPSPPRNGTEAAGGSGEPSGGESPQKLPPDLEQCPNCAANKWEIDDDGYISCKKCCHPYGEPAGDVDDDRVTKQRALTIKHLEATMRAFDDLNLLCSHVEHKGIMAQLKAMWRKTKDWK